MVTLVPQVLRGYPSAIAVIDHHPAEQGTVGVDRYGGQVALAQAAGNGVLDAQAHHDQAVQAAVHGHAGQHRGGGERGRLVVEDQYVDLQLGRRRQEAGQPAEVRPVRGERRHHPDPARAAPGQADRLHLRHETQVVDGCEDALPGRGADPVGLVEHVGNGRNADPSALGDLVDRDSMTRRQRARPAPVSAHARARSRKALRFKHCTSGAASGAGCRRDVAVETTPRRHAGGTADGYDPANCHQFTLNREPLPPVNRR